MIESDRHNQNSRAPNNDSSDDKIDARERLSPLGRRYASPGDELQHERSKGESAQLTELGRKLLGLESWG